MSECDDVHAIVSRVCLSDRASLSRLAELTGREACILRGLEAAARAEDWTLFERYVLAASRHPGPEMAEVLRGVLSRRMEDINNEDIIEVLGQIGDPNAVGVLEDMILWEPDWDDFHHVAVKAVWALGDIGTPAAYDVLRDAAAVGPVEPREWAIRILRKANQPL